MHALLLLLNSVSLVAPAESTLVLKGGSYLDVRAGVVRPNGAIVVRGGRIVELHLPGSGWRAPADAEVIMLEARTILPGLIDAHVHLTLSGEPATNAAATLAAGFTTVVDLGSTQGAAVKLRDKIAAREITGPTVVAAGSWIGAKGGVCEFGGATVSTATEAGTRARDDVQAGADILKICVTGWTADAVKHPDSVELKSGTISSVLEIARRTRKPVYAHAIGQAGALLAAKRGARALAHTPVVDPAGVSILKRSGTYVISTVSTVPAGAARERVSGSLRLLHKAGVPIVLGTDAGVLRHGDNARELVALTEIGLSPLEALRTATVNAAALLQRRRLGQIEAGANADFVIVEGNPLQDISVVQRPVFVIKGGTIVRQPGGSQ
jgi:imidazolonepropionase-like amidohydrolase